ncbi:MAG: hypothetical protein KUL77_10650 [Thermomonas sp.]|uniref:hypothetical protein n=1 Tax=Thermomonas sp. TaxID=1971895 RepID=UPI001EC8FE47|nr:hypothetical protein [Thermomonas sp.]MBV2210007.1 hypothetical protein [Thermomonas sp.]
MMNFPIPIGLLLFFATFAGIGLLMWYGSRIRKRDANDTSRPWVSARAVVKSVQALGPPTATDMVPVRLWVLIDNSVPSGGHTKVPVDTEVPKEALGRFGNSTVIRVLHHPTNRIVCKLDGVIPLDDTIR